MDQKFETMLKYLASRAGAGVCEMPSGKRVKPTELIGTLSPRWRDQAVRVCTMKDHEASESVWTAPPAPLMLAFRFIPTG